MALDRFKHSIIYEQSTSEIKDDIVSLVAAVKSGNGAMLTRQEAAFLLWYHALEGEDKQDECCNNGAVNACLGVMDTAEASSADKTCCSGILMTLCHEEHNRELVIRGKSPNNNAAAILHSLMHEGVDLVRQYTAKTLCLIAEEPTARGLLLRALEQALPHDTYRHLLVNCKDGTAIASLAGLISALLNGRPDLKSDALSAGLVGALLTSMRYHKADVASGCLANCLLQFAMERESWPHIHKADGITLLVDMLGPPPTSILNFEKEHWRHLVDPSYAAELIKRREASEEADKAKGASEGDSASASTPGSARKKTTDRPTTGSGSKPKESEASTEGDGKDANGNGRDADGARLPDPEPKTLLSINTAGLKWHAIVTMPTYSAAAGCLYELAQSPDYMHEMSARLAACRLVPLVALTMAAEGDGKKKKGKKKGLSLQPDQVEALTRITGCLKFLSLININRCRIARLGAIVHLIPLYEEGPQTLLRRNAQVILSNVAMMAENGQLMLEGKLPEEFLIPVPMRLTPEEVVDLEREFPAAEEKKKEVEVGSADEKKKEKK